MNTSRPQLPRGNKLFLPKLDYAKFTKETQLSGKKLNINSTVSEEKESSRDFGHEQASPLLNSNSYSMNSFTRFSVLPPIQNSFQAARRLSHTKRLSRVLFSPAMGSSPVSNGADVVQNEADGVRRRRDAVFRNQQSDYATLQIVGNTAFKTSNASRVNIRGVPRRSYSRPGLPNDEYACQYCEEALLKRTRSRTNADKISERWESSRPHKCKISANYLQQPNSENLGLQNNNRGKDEIDPTLGGNEVVLIAPNRKNSSNFQLLVDVPKARPVSRCEINVDMSDGENPTHRLERDETVASNQMNITIPMIEVHPPKTETPSKDIETTYGGKDAPPVIAPPRIQLLIDSIDTAKGELPNGSSEVPYTSVRERRRRSALCRNNSKQVDDFLLVHNLRDLGLL